MRRLRFLPLFFALIFTVGGSARRDAPVIVMVSVDTLRADHLGAYGYSERTSPFIDKLAEKGVVFEEAIVPLPATSPSHASLLTSVSPWKHGLATNGLSMKSGIDTLPSALKRAGYHTAGVVAVEHLGSAYGFSRGFDDFSQPKGESRGPAVEVADDATVINAKARAAIDRYMARGRSRPLFLFVHYFDCHFPYRWWDPSDDPKKAWEAAEMNDRSKQIRRYDDGIRHVDGAIRQLYGYLEQKKLTRNMIFVVTSDHGEQIGDHGLPVGHADIYRETVRVPLVIVGKGIPERRVAETVSVMDVAVTLARAAGTRILNSVDGHDLTPAIDRTSAVFGWLAPAKPKRALTVTGNPGYTQSVGFIENKRWFIKNFDWVYRDAWVITPAPQTDRPTQVAPVAERDAYGYTYKIPVRHYRPFVVTIEHVAAKPQCEAEAIVKILPSTQYFHETIKFRGSIRIIVPAARQDLLSLTVHPASCAGRTTFRAARSDDLAVPQKVQPRMTDLYAGLVPRKQTSRDELYDVSSDPGMLRSLANRGEMWRRDQALAARFKIIAPPDVRSQVVPPEEQRRLRSLGYLQ